MTNIQITRFEECSTLWIQRESDNSHVYWFVCGDVADWVGFMDDLGNFVPIDWC